MAARPLLRRYLVRWTGVLAMISLTAVIAGCSKTTPGMASAPSGAAAAHASPPAAAPTTTAGYELDDLGRRLQQTLLTEDVMAGQGLTHIGQPHPVLTAENTRHALVQVCGTRMASDDKIDRAWEAFWGARRQQVFDAHQMAVHYDGMAGAAAIGEIQQRLTCGTYVDNTVHTIVGTLPLPAVADVDAEYAYCETMSHGPVTFCTVLLARGNIAAALKVEGMNDKDTRDAARNLAPLLGTALSRS